MLFAYEALDREGNRSRGTIDAFNVDAAINSIQHRGLVIISIKNTEKKSLLNFSISFLNRISTKDIVILSRQMATLFSAQVSALRVFSLLAAENHSPELRKHLSEVADDLQGGSSISKALAKHPRVFSDFYVNMVHSGEESGKLDQTFEYLANYLDRSYEVTSKVKNAMVYPAFVMVVFVGVMTFMMTNIIPKISEIIESAGQDIPIYTKIVIGVSHFIVDYGWLIFIVIVLGLVALLRYRRTEGGRIVVSKFKLSIPYAGDLFRKLYLSRLADNMNTMLSSAIPIVKSIEITASVIGDATYESVLKVVADDVRTGSSVSSALSAHPEIPSILVQMVKVGEETGELGNILNTLSKFYAREVTNAVDTLIGLIEPAMIILLAGGVGILLAAVLVPIYNLSSSIA
ncbi:MAG TPA: type II secretion system F family protein [Candidatus Paceibacterota bacterium]